VDRGGEVGQPRLIRLDPEDTARALARVPLFAGCPEEDRRRIAALAHVVRFDDGAVIVPEGEEGRGFYLLLAGHASVRRGEAEIGRLGPGDFFGEIALLEGTPRVASVVADGPVVCLGILRADFRALLVRQPRLALRILEEAGRRDRGREGPDGTMARVAPPE
jgi:CRP-like cAMP-binding protein